MTKKINVFVKGKMGVGKTTFITTLRDILKKNKSFKELFDNYEFDIYEFTEDDDQEYQSAVNKKWTIQDNNFTEDEFVKIIYKKSLFKKIWSFIKALFKKLLPF